MPYFNSSLIWSAQSTAQIVLFFSFVRSLVVLYTHIASVCKLAGISSKCIICRVPRVSCESTNVSECGVPFASLSYMR